MGHSAVGISDPKDGTEAKVIATAPGSDTGQAGLAVRVISSLATSGGGGAATIADGADVAEGATTDAAVTSNTTGTISGKLRGLVSWAYTRMPAALGQTNMAGSLPVTLASDQASVPVAASVADGADVAEGATTDAAVTSNTTGTISGKLRGLVSWAYTRMPAALGQTTMSASLPVVLPSDQASISVAATLAAGTALAGKVSASNETSTVYNGTSALTPLFASIAASASGVTTVVAAVGGKQIRVINYVLVSNGTVNVKWQSHVAGDVTGLAYLVANTGISSPYVPVGLFQTTSGEALDINLSANVAVGGHLTYITV